MIIFSWNGFLESFGKYCEQLAEAGNSDLLSSLGSILTKWNSPNTPHQFEILCNLKFSFKARHHFVKENCWHITSSLNWFVTFQKFTLCYRNYWGGILHEMKTLVKQGWNIIFQNLCQTQYSRNWNKQWMVGNNKKLQITRKFSKVYHCL